MGWQKFTKIWQVGCRSIIYGYLNGDQVINETDSQNPFLSGGIGIGVQEDNMTVYYDDIIVRPTTWPAILFLDDFNSGSPDTLWRIREGTWEVINDMWEIYWRGSGSAHFVTLVEDCDWDKIKFQMRTRMHGSDLVGWLKSYLFFMVQDDQNYYRFGIHGDANCIDLYKRVNGNWEYKASTSFSPTKDIWYTLKVEVTQYGSRSKRIKGYVDDSLVINYLDSDNPFWNGGIGLGVLEDNMVNDYDDVIIYRYP